MSSRIEAFGRDAGGALSALGIDAAALARVSAGDESMLEGAGIAWSGQEYGAFQLACGMACAMACALFVSAASLLFGSDLSLLLLAVPCAFFGVLAARLHVRGIEAACEGEVNANLLSALRQVFCELKSGAVFPAALARAARGEHGRVSALFGEALALVREGGEWEAALREAGEKTGSVPFREFAASAAYACSSGADLSESVSKTIRALESSRRHALSAYANECSMLSTVAVVFAGVLPGMLVFALAESGFVMSVRPPAEIFAFSFCLVFPMAKYFLQAKLALAARGVFA